MRTIEDKREYDKQYYLNNRAILIDKQLKYYYKNKKKILLQTKDRYVTQKDKISKRNLLTKINVVHHYSNGDMKCIKCGFLDIRALQLDHINGGGTKQRGTMGGTRYYQLLIKENYPNGFQILCANCNAIKRMKNKEHRGAE